MKISWNWLQNLVDINNNAASVGEKLTLHTAELEEIVEVKKYFEKVLVGEVVSINPHPKSEKLSIGKFNLGDLGEKQIIFGQVHEVSVGQFLPIALEGANLQSGIQIKNSEIQGEKSEGMICDNSELGLKGEGLLNFDDKNFIGKSLPEICPEFADSLFDIDNKSLTHRPDLMGHRGFAQELSAIFKINLFSPEPAVSVSENLPELTVNILDEDCIRFNAMKLENITVSSPELKTRIRLENLGIKSISDMVDISNEIMLDYGQPMHAYDADSIIGNIEVRKAKIGETFLGLDNNEYELTEKDLVIADSQNILGLAGIMGGLKSSVTANTKNIILEVGNFNPVTIRKTSQYHGIRTESSMRFEKSLDPYMTKRSLFSAAEKILEICPDSKVASKFMDYFPNPAKPLFVKLDPNKVRQFAGVEIPDEEIESSLENLGFELKKEDSVYNVKIPFTRSSKDVSIEEDLIEEVVRLYGFARIPAKLPTLPIVSSKENSVRTFEWKFRDFFSQNQFLEVYNYSFVNKDDHNFTGNNEYIEVENPLSDEYQFLRRNLISNMVKNIDSELRTHKRLQFFELGKTFIPQGEVLPKEEIQGLVFLADLKENENNLFFELKHIFQEYIAQIGDLNLKFLPLEKSETFQHPSKTAEIFVEDVFIGTISTLHPSFNPVKKSSMVFAEFNLEILAKLVAKKKTKFKKISTFPRVFRDLSIIVPEKTLYGDIKEVAFHATENLSDLELFDEYSDSEKLGKGIKNLAFHLTFQSQDKTLEDQEINADFDIIVKKLSEKLDAQLRSDFDQQKA